MHAIASLMTSLRLSNKQKLKVSGTHVGVRTSPPTYLSKEVYSIKSRLERKRQQDIFMD